MTTLKNLRAQEQHYLQIIREARNTESQRPNLNGDDEKRAWDGLENVRRQIRAMQ
jgi:hypothetical protein